VQLVDPPLRQFGPVTRHDLVRSGVGPGPRIPHSAQPRIRLVSRVRGPPVRFVAGDIASDLRRPGAERTHERGQLGDLARLRIEGEAARGERVPEHRIAHDGGVPDAVDRVKAVPHADRMQTPPLPFGEHPSVDLQVQMPVRIARPGGVMPHGHRLDLSHRNL